MRYHPRFKALEEEGHASGVEKFTFVEIGELPHSGSIFQKAVKANALRLLKSLAADAIFRAKASEICHMVDGFTIDLEVLGGDDSLQSCIPFWGTLIMRPRSIAAAQAQLTIAVTAGPVPEEW